MKTIKTKLTQTGPALYIKALILALSMGSITLILILLILSALLSISGNLPHDAVIWLDITSCAVAAFIGAYVCASTIKCKGFIWGFITGLVMFSIQFTAGYIADSGELSYISLIKLIIFAIVGCLGGIKGVNKKEKIRIK